MRRVAGPNVSETCARERWLLVQRDPRFGSFLRKLVSQGFDPGNASAPEYLAEALGVRTLGDDRLTHNQAVFDAVTARFNARLWTKALLEPARKHFPQVSPTL